MRQLLEQPVRILAEVRGLDQLAATSRWLTKLDWGLTEAGEVRVNFDIVEQEKVYEAVLIYPNLFPEAPAYVRPRTPDEAWSTHQYPMTGTLCLEWGPDNWRPEITGADLVLSTRNLLAFERDGPARGIEAPSRHNLTIGQRFRFEVSRFVVTPELADTVRARTTATPVALTVTTTLRFGRAVAFATKAGGEADPPLARIPPELAAEFSLGSWLRTGWLVRCDEWESLPETANTQSAVREYLKSKGCWPWPDDADRTAFLLIVDENFRLLPIALSEGDGTTAYKYVCIDCTQWGQERQPERNLLLGSKSVAIIGLGSVGSKVAVSLARSGMGRLLLIDDDIMQPGNLSRNQLDWLSVGYEKVFGVKGAIKLVRPEADVQCRTFRFAGQESASYNTTVLEQIAACEIVIDATANPKVFSSIAAICTRRRVPLVWGELFAGGFGALMARSVPDIDASPLCVRAAIHEYLADKPEAPFKHVQDYDADIDDDVLVAGDAEVSHLAATLTQYAIDALVSADNLRFPFAAYLLGFQRAWIFEAPFDTHPIACPREVSCPREQGSEEANASALEEVLSFFSKKC